MRCRSRKRSYGSEIDAMLALDRIHRQRNIDNLDKYERRCYPCRDCGNWHLTSMRHIEGEEGYEGANARLPNMRRCDA